VIALLLALALAAPPAPPSPLPRVAVRTALGELVVEVDVVRAPATAANFLRYVDAGRYAGGSFHRTVTTSPDNQPGKTVKIDVVQAGPAPGKDFPPVALERTRDTGLLHVDGAVSMARMGNMPHKNATGELNRLADVAYTFAKARDAPHSLNQQNILMGLGATGAGLAGFVPQVLGGLAGGRAANMALNSDWLRRLVLGQAQQGVLGPAILGLREGAYRFAPVAAANVTFTTLLPWLLVVTFGWHSLQATGL